MKIFISSPITGYERFRDVAADTVETLGHQVLRAEDFPASAQTPQQACLRAVRDSDVVVLLLGAHYGAVQAAGLSATHEEYREARDTKPLLVFVEADVEREPQQRAFLTEVEGWASGHLRASYRSPDELRTKLTRSLHDHEMATVTGPPDEAEMLARAQTLLPQRQRGTGVSSGLTLAVAPGPHQQILRPVEVGADALARDVQKEALFGDHAVLAPSEGTAVAVRGSALVLEQESARVLVDQTGGICIVQPSHARQGWRTGGIPSLIEEDIAAALVRTLRFSGWLLQRIDPTHRLSDVVVVAHLNGAGYMPWRTRAEQLASPNTASMSQGADDITVTLTPLSRRRQALTHDAEKMAEDLTELLRREIVR